MRNAACLSALMCLATSAHAQTIVPGDPYAGDPVGVVADPCPSHPEPQGDAEWQIYKLRGLTRDFGGRCRYRTENAALKAKGERVDIVFIGDSITERPPRGASHHADQLEAQGVRHFHDLGKIAPSLTIRPSDHPVNANVSLRGVGTFAYGLGVESSVAVTVDGAALPFQARAFTELPDVAQIEVLRGPQSTLYGKAASAGLIKIMTIQPTKEFHLQANTLVSTDNEYGANFSVTGPFNDTLGYVVGWLFELGWQYPQPV